MGLFKKSSSSSKHDSRATSTTISTTTTNGGPRSPSTYSRQFNGSPAANASLPDLPLPRAPDAGREPAAYLRSIHAVRERSKKIYDLARKNQLKHFDVDMSKFGETAHYVVSIIKVSFGKTDKRRYRADLAPRETMRQTLLPFQLTAAGNISKSVDVPVWTSSCRHGRFL